MNLSPNFTYAILETGPDDRSRFRDETVVLGERKPQLFLSDPLDGGKVQFRESPVGYFMDFHPTQSPQWTFVLGGELEIGLQDGTARVFRAGDALFATDLVPTGRTFDPKLHGHTARQIGDKPVVTVLVR